MTKISADIPAVTGLGAEVTLESAALQELADSLRGNLLLPGNEGYDKARQVLNPGIDKKPALVIQPEGATDIRRAVEFARGRDRFWAVRGGGGNFGIVTSFEFGLHPMKKTVVGGEILFPAAMAKEVYKVYREHGLDAPDNLYCDMMLSAGVEGSGGVAGVHVCWSGPEAEAEKMFAPFYALGEPVVNTVKSRDYVEIQQSWDTGEADPRNNASYLKSGFINDLPDESDKRRHGNYQGNFPRLLEIKKKYDPTNLFRLNANIKA